MNALIFYQSLLAPFLVKLKRPIRETKRKQSIRCKHFVRWQLLLLMKNVLLSLISYFLVVKNVACYHCRILQLIVPDYIL